MSSPHSKGRCNGAINCAICAKRASVPWRLPGDACGLPASGGTSAQPSVRLAAASAAVSGRACRSNARRPRTLEPPLSAAIQTPSAASASQPQAWRGRALHCPPSWRRTRTGGRWRQASWFQRASGVYQVGWSSKASARPSKSLGWETARQNTTENHGTFEFPTFA
jgi:hypothetical protein